MILSDFLNNLKKQLEQLMLMMAVQGESLPLMRQQRENIQP